MEKDQMLSKNEQISHTYILYVGKWTKFDQLRGHFPAFTTLQFTQSICLLYNSVSACTLKIPCTKSTALNLFDGGTACVQSPPAASSSVKSLRLDRENMVSPLERKKLNLE